jgi:glycerophosphoryl diester phosphodiesterase
MKHADAQRGPAFAWPYPRVAAHRGGGALAPENTLAAIELGARLGYRMIEFDVKLSADGVPFLLHDATLERTTSGTGAAAALRFEELARLDAGNWFAARFAGEPVPSLAAVAERCAALGLAANIEIKPSPGAERETGRRVAVQARVSWAGQPLAPLFSSFSRAALASAQAAAPEIPRGLLVEHLPSDWQQQAAALKCLSMHLDHRHLDATMVRELKDAGLRVLAYTVNDPARARLLAGWGVDTICTDRIDLIGAGFLD